MKSKTGILITTLTAIAFINGCGGGSDGAADSEDIRTSGLHATIEVTSDDDNRSEISVILRVGNSSSNTFLTLTSDDTITALLNDSLSQLVDIKDGRQYRTSFNSTGAGLDTASYRISFTRPNDDDAPNSTVTMPAGLTGLTSNPATTFSRGTEVLTLSWNATATNNSIPISITGDCIENTSVTVQSSTGVFAINPTTITSDSTPEENCEVTVISEESRSGTIDPAYGEGGVISAKRITSMTLTSTP